MKVEGLDGLKKLLDHVEQRDKFLRDQNGSEVNLKTFQPAVMGTFLHQDTTDEDGAMIKEEDSAKFEQKHPELFKFLQTLKRNVFRILEP